MGAVLRFLVVLVHQHSPQVDLLTLPCPTGNSTLRDDQYPGFPSPAIDEEGQKGHKSDIFFAALETTRMPINVTDPHQDDNPIIFANRAFLEMTCYSAEELIGRNCRFLQGKDTDRDTVDTIRTAIRERREHRANSRCFYRT